MKEDVKKRPNNRIRKLEECYQNLEQAKVNGDKWQIKIWTDIIKKLESIHAKNKD